MIESASNENGTSNGENGKVKAAASNGHRSEWKPSNSTLKAPDSQPSVDDLLKQARRHNKTILDQSQRIEELESYLACVVTLTAKVKELELELESCL